MLSLIFSVLCFVAINKVQSVTAPVNLSLLLINETSSRCEFNVANNHNLQDQVNLCLNEEFFYECYNNLNVNNISLQCHLTNNGNRCNNIYIGNNDENNVTLGCYYEQLSALGGNFAVTGANDCVFGIFSDLNNFNNTNNSLVLLCAVYTPLIQPTGFNNTAIIQKGQNYYNIPFLGLKIRKHFARTYGIVILVAIALILCLLSLCCYGMCHYCYVQTQKNDNRNYQSRRMPQSSNACDV